MRVRACAGERNRATAAVLRAGEREQSKAAVPILRARRSSGQSGSSQERERQAGHCAGAVDQSSASEFILVGPTAEP
jgi:hypothetical protein